MAIKVVQGLIDVKGSEKAPARSVQVSPSSGQGAGSNVSSALRQSLLTSQPSLQAAVQDASVSLIRSRAANTDTKVRESDKAQGLADSIARRVRDEEKGAFDAHPDLASNVARDHFR